MTRMSARKPEHGAALVISLVLIAVASIGAVTAMRSGHLQDRMASNQHNKVISQMAAEAGAGEFVEWLCDPSRTEDLTADWADEELRDDLPSEIADQPQLPPFGYFYIPTEPEWSSSPIDVTVVGIARQIDGEPLAESHVNLVIERTFQGSGGENSEEENPGLLSHPGLLSGGNIEPEAAFTLEGSAHANGTFGKGKKLTLRNTQDGDGNPIYSTITAQAVDIGNGSSIADGASVTSRAPNVNIDNIFPTTFIDNYIASTDGNRTTSCSIPSTGDLGGGIYYCNGSVSASSGLRNGVLIATGSITVSGSMGDVSVISKGNITINGIAPLSEGNQLGVALVTTGNVNFGRSSNAYVIVYANGNVSTQGSANLDGAIVARGNITFQSATTFSQYRQFNPGLVVPGAPGDGEDDEEEDSGQISCEVRRWVQVL